MSDSRSPVAALIQEFLSCTTLAHSPEHEFGQLSASWPMPFRDLIRFQRSGHTVVISSPTTKLVPQQKLLFRWLYEETRRSLSRTSCSVGTGCSPRVQRGERHPCRRCAPGFAAESKLWQGANRYPPEAIRHNHQPWPINGLHYTSTHHF